MTDKPEKKTFVAYDHVSGVPYLVDPSTGVVAPIDLNLPEGKEGLKNESGHYRAEVRNECRRLYMAGVSLTDISERTGVPATSLENWAYQKHNPSKYDSSWAAERKIMLAEARQMNEERYAIVERGALNRVQEYLNSPKSEITNPTEFVIFASGVEKLSKALAAPKAAERAPAPMQQLNINVNPLTPAEARVILQNDPIKRIAEARTKEQANIVLEDATIINDKS